MKIVFAGLLPLCLVACASPEEAEIKKVEDHIRAQMVDPDSAQFSDMRRKRSGLVCGMVNGKNTLGGYMGKKYFVARIKGENIDFEIVQDRVPNFMSEDYPAEEFGECFPEMVPIFKAIIGEDYQPSGN